MRALSNVPAGRRFPSLNVTQRQRNDTDRRKKVRSHASPFMTKQRYSSAAATSKLHQKSGIIYTSVATSDMQGDTKKTVITKNRITS